MNPSVNLSDDLKLLMQRGITVTSDTNVASSRQPTTDRNRTVSERTRAKFDTAFVAKEDVKTNSPIQNRIYSTNGQASNSSEENQPRQLTNNQINWRPLRKTTDTAEKLHRAVLNYNAFGKIQIVEKNLIQFRKPNTGDREVELSEPKNTTVVENKTTKNDSESVALGSFTKSCNKYHLKYFDETQELNSTVIEKHPAKSTKTAVANDTDFSAGNGKNVQNESLSTIVEEKPEEKVTKTVTPKSSRRTETDNNSPSSCFDESQLLNATVKENNNLRSNPKNFNVVEKKLEENFSQAVSPNQTRKTQSKKLVFVSGFKLDVAAGTRKILTPEELNPTVRNFSDSVTPRSSARIKIVSKTALDLLKRKNSCGHREVDSPEASDVGKKPKEYFSRKM